MFFFLVSSWYCFSILNLADCEGFRWDPAWIARRLGLSKPEIVSALDRLERVGIIITENGKKRISQNYIANLGGVPSESIRNYHREILQKAIQALDFQSLEERDVSGVGLAVDPKHLPSIKKDIAEFQEQLLAKYSKGKRKHVYQLEVAFFRLSQGDTND